MVTARNWDSHLVGHKSQKYMVTNCSTQNEDWIQRNDRSTSLSLFIPVSSDCVQMPLRTVRTHIRLHLKMHCKQISLVLQLFAAKGKHSLLIAWARMLLLAQWGACLILSLFLIFIYFTICTVVWAWAWVYFCNSSVVSRVYSIETNITGTAWTLCNNTIRTFFRVFTQLLPAYYFDNEENETTKLGSIYSRSPHNHCLF